MKLYGYWRSSATYRARIALALKEIEFDYIPVNLLDGEQRRNAYLAKNPAGLVPALETDDGAVITQSLAVLEYLEDAFPAPSLLPNDAVARGHARAIAATLACEAQPFMNLRIQRYLKETLSFDEDAMTAWLNQWPGGAMAAAEKLVAAHGGEFCVGDAPSIADCCLVPQVYGAQRFGIDLSAMPNLKRVFDTCETLPAFKKAHPDIQPDAPKGNS